MAKSDSIIISPTAIMKRLTIFYDPECGLCTTFKHWLTMQRKYVETRFIPYQSQEALQLLPNIHQMQANREVIVLADDGRWWQGETAWLTCLWSTLEYRPWSYRFRNPLLRPLIQKIVHLISENRLTLSRIPRLTQDHQVADAIRALPQPMCQTDACHIAPLNLPHP